NDPTTEASFVAPNFINEELDYRPRLNIDFLIEIAKIEKKKKDYLEIKEIDSDDYAIELDKEISRLRDEHVENIGSHLAKPIEKLIDEVIILGKYEININDIHYHKETQIDSLLWVLEEGINGGFTYGFQDKEIYKTFLQKALTEGSTSAELSGLAFSSQGGYGNQVARFDNDLTAIKSLTAMGRVHSYAVERIGRIGVFWHKAKHVIEYERTVVPSEYEMANQFSYLGRPVVRKIREYIEILEPHKKYPDFDGHSHKDTGAVNACVFKSTIIPVSNSWGKLVNGKILTKNKEIVEGLVGWEVPLWYEGADESLFPKPQVLLLLEPPKDANLEHSTAQLAEPQNLVFYTAYSSGIEGEDITSDVSRWRSVFGVDFTDKPVFDEAVLSPYNKDSSATDRLDDWMPNAIDVLPGHGRFTFKVEPQVTPAGMANVYQPESGISGVMRTVSMQRNSGVTSIEGLELNFLKEIYDIQRITPQNKESIKGFLEIIRQKVDYSPKISDGHLNMSRLSPILNFLWKRIIKYSDDFYSIIDIELTKCNAEILKDTNSAQLEQLIELCFSRIPNYEIELGEFTNYKNIFFNIENKSIVKLKEYKITVEKIIQAGGETIENLKNNISNEIDEIVKTAKGLGNLLQTTDIDAVTLVLENLKAGLNQVIGEEMNLFQIDLQNFLDNYTPLVNPVNYVENAIKEGKKIIGTDISKITNGLKNAKLNLVSEINTNNWEVGINNIFVNIKETTKNNIFYFLNSKLGAFIWTLDNFIEVNEMDDKFQAIIKDISEDRLTDITLQIINTITDQVSLLSTKADQINSVVVSANSLHMTADNVLTNYRSVWEEITAPGMGLNRKTI
ncbi:MAG: hypothetical protein WKF91_23665, partial [Segetibacter sp.]